MGRRPGLIVAALCLVSLAGLRDVEETLATAWLPMQGWVDALSPERDFAPDGDPQPEALAAVLSFGSEAAAPQSAGPDVAPETVAAVDRAWRHGLLARPRPRQGRELIAAPVLSVDLARREMIIAAPERGLHVDTAVTHHGRLVGTLRSWSDASDVVERNGRAKIALLGHPATRPVAGIWKPEGLGQPLRFLLGSHAYRPRVSHPSRRLVALHGERVYTRDVSPLGDAFPPGLLLGEILPLDRDLPGGAPDGVRADEAWLEPATDGSELALVVVEVDAGVELPAQTWAARRVGAVSADGQRLRLDRGSLDGLAPGQLVVNGHRLVGVVGAVGPLSAVVDRRAPSGLLLVQDGDQLIPVAQEVSAWPDAWRPVPGQNVWLGHRELGALFLGRITAVGPGSWDLEPAALARSREVTVAEL